VLNLQKLQKGQSDLARSFVLNPMACLRDPVYLHPRGDLLQIIQEADVECDVALPPDYQGFCSGTRGPSLLQVVAVKYRGTIIV
jgi:hypothetical protein